MDTKQKDYNYPGSWTLINKANIRDVNELQDFERFASLVRQREGIPTAGQDGSRVTPSHLHAIHKQLFGDVYEWAGQIRESNIRKMSNANTFSDPSKINTELDKAFSKIQHWDGILANSRAEFISNISEFMSDLNRIHPYREGNGRTIRAMATQLAHQQGYIIAFDKMTKSEWSQASKDSFESGSHKPLENYIKNYVAPEKLRGFAAYDEAALEINKSAREAVENYKYTQDTFAALYPEQRALISAFKKDIVKQKYNEILLKDPQGAKEKSFVSEITPARLEAAKNRLEARLQEKINVTPVTKRVVAGTPVISPETPKKPQKGR